VVSQQGSSAGVVASSSFCREEAKGGAIFFRIRTSFGHNKKHGGRWWSRLVFKSTENTIIERGQEKPLWFFEGKD